VNSLNSLALSTSSPAAVGGATSAIGTGPSVVVLSASFQSPPTQRSSTVVVPQPSRIGAATVPPTDPPTLVTQMATLAFSSL
jgi:hypothetical protein